MIWKEFWYGREQDENQEKPIFKTKKNNLPRNYKSPNLLKTFLGAVKSEILDPKNRNKVKCNLPPEEIKALKELIQMQKDRKITIKPCDKGAGIIILDFEEYMRACYTHLNAEQKNPNGDSQLYYIKVDSIVLEKAKDKITQIISKDEFEAMNQENKNPGRFYCTFKVHKEHNEGTAPPERPIISGSASITENSSLYVEHHIKGLANTHASYLQDTPHFLRIIDEINKGEKLDINAILATIDVSGLLAARRLYTSKCCCCCLSVCLLCVASN